MPVERHGSPGRTRSPDCRAWMTSTGLVSTAILAIPFDSGVSYRPGAGSGRPGFGWGRSCCAATTPTSTSNRGRPVKWRTQATSRCNPFDIAAALEQVQRAAGQVLQQCESVGDHRRRPHGRAAVAACDARQARTGRTRPLRRPPGHVGHLLRRAVHARHSVSACGRRGLAGPRRVGTCRNPGSALLGGRPRRRQGAGVRDRDHGRRGASTVSTRRSTGSAPELASDRST